MRPTWKSLHSAGVLTFSLLAGVWTIPASAQAQAPAPAPAPAVLPALPPATTAAVPRRPAPMGTSRAALSDTPVRAASMTAPAAPSPSPVRAAAMPAPASRAASAPPSGYWGPAPPPPPKRKPTALSRFFGRIGDFIGVDEDMGTIPVYRDPTTGRTNTGISKPWMKRLPE